MTRVKIEDNVFFGEEMTRIGFYEENNVEKVLVEVFTRDEGGFMIRKSFVERGNPEPSHACFEYKSLDIINKYLKKQEELDGF